MNPDKCNFILSVALQQTMQITNINNNNNKNAT